MSICHIVQTTLEKCGNEKLFKQRWRMNSAQYDDNLPAMYVLSRREKWEQLTRQQTSFRNINKYILEDFVGNLPSVAW